MHTINTTALTLVKQYEGFSPKAYLCPAGVWTIGYGTTQYPTGQKVKQGDTVSQAQAEELLVVTLQKFADIVAKKVTAPLTPNRFNALVCFVYNVGPAAFSRSTLLRKVNHDPCDPTIRGEFLKWVNAGGKRLEGLVRRRTAEANLYFSTL